MAPVEAGTKRLALVNRTLFSASPDTRRSGPINAAINFAPDGTEALKKERAHGEVNWNDIIATATGAALSSLPGMAAAKASGDGTGRGAREASPKRPLHSQTSEVHRASRAIEPRIAEGVDENPANDAGIGAAETLRIAESPDSGKTAQDGAGSAKSAPSLNLVETASEKEDSAARIAELIESLRPNSKGDEVKELQNRLGLKPQGTYGQKTLAAVKKYVIGDELSRINAELKTNVDFSSMLEYEGFRLDGYVPGVTGSKSGVTIGMGFDIGQFNEAEIKVFNLPKTLTEKLLPYAELRLADAEEKLKQTGGLTVSIEEVRNITYAVKRKFTRDVAAKYDAAIKEGVPKFVDLTPAQQTVVFSRFFHQGLSFLRYENSEPWWAAVTSGKWEEVQSNLRNYPFAVEDWYKIRVGKEADLLGDTSMNMEKK